jgi:hypothetical protein
LLVDQKSYSDALTLIDSFADDFSETETTELRNEITSLIINTLNEDYKSLSSNEETKMDFLILNREFFPSLQYFKEIEALTVSRVLDELRNKNYEAAFAFMYRYRESINSSTFTNRVNSVFNAIINDSTIDNAENFRAIISRNQALVSNDRFLEINQELTLNVFNSFESEEISSGELYIIHEFMRMSITNTYIEKSFADEVLVDAFQEFLRSQYVLQTDLEGERYRFYDIMSLRQIIMQTPYLFEESDLSSLYTLADRLAQR